MKRWAWNSFCLFSLLVFLSSVTLWVRSYFVEESLVWCGTWHDQTFTPPAFEFSMYGIVLGRGTAQFSRSHGHNLPVNALVPGWTFSESKHVRKLIALHSRTDRINLRFGGFQLLHTVYPYTQAWISVRNLCVPLWLFLPAALPPVLWLRGWRRSRRRGFPVEMPARSTAPNVQPPANIPS